LWGDVNDNGAVKRGDKSGLRYQRTFRLADQSTLIQSQYLDTG